MGKVQPELGEKERFELRPGVGGFPNWQGMDQDSNPGSIPIFKFRRIINARFREDGILSRGGQSKLNTSVLDSALACVQGLFDYQAATPHKMYGAFDGCFGISAAAGASIGQYDWEQSPRFQRVIYSSAATNNYVLAVFDGKMHVGLDSDLKALQLIVYPYGTEALSASGTSQDTPITSYSGFTIRNMLAFDSKLFVGLDAGAGASKISAWDGLSVRDDLTGINVPTGFGLWRETIIVGFAAATNLIKYRTVGAPPGTWTNVAPGAGTVAMVSRGVSYKDIFYFPDGSTSIWSYDGTTLSAAKTIAGATFRCIAVFNGFLYAGYETATPDARLAKFDGSSWTDVDKNFTTQFAGTTSVRTLEAYRGSLYAGCIQSSNAKIFQSPLTVTSGTWLTVTLPMGTASGDVNQFVLF